MDEAARATRLFRTLLGDPTVAQLSALREHPTVDVTSVAVNGDRVDVVAATTGAEWRIVFSTEDMEVVDWLHVYTRPDVFTGIADGRAVIVNGPSSSGKSTLVRAIAARASVPFVTFDEPMFGSVDPGVLIWRDRAPRLHTGFLDGIAALARAGNFVALSAGGHPAALVSAAFRDVPTVVVGLDCIDAERARRERRRDDVPGGLWAASPDIHEGWRYDLRADTSTTPVEEIADAVITLLG